MRDVQRFLEGAFLIGSGIGGWFYQPAWLCVPAGTSLALLIIEDRVVRQRIGEAAWPSEGYARFLVGTNLALLLRSAILNASILAIGSALHSVLGG